MRFFEYSFPGFFGGQLHRGSINGGELARAHDCTGWMWKSQP
jgi:hypothetical protein